MRRPRSSTTTTESGNGGRRWYCRRGSHPRIEACRRLPLHRFIHDGISPIDRLRLVPDDRHGDGSRHAGALERPDGRPAHVMHQGARTAGDLAGIPPRCPEVADALVTSVRANYDTPPWRTTAGTTVFAPFKEDTSYFGDRRFQWMINFRVRDLDRWPPSFADEAWRSKWTPEVYPNGRFARLSDPEGNPIQLWQPGGKDPG